MIFNPFRSIQAKARRLDADIHPYGPARTGLASSVSAELAKVKGKTEQDHCFHTYLKVDPRLDKGIFRCAIPF